MPNGFDVTDRPVSQAQNAEPRNSRPHSVPPSLEEEDAELVLESGKMAAQGGGIDTKIPGSTCDAAKPSDMDYKFKVT